MQRHRSLVNDRRRRGGSREVPGGASDRPVPIRPVPRRGRLVHDAPPAGGPRGDAAGDACGGRDAPLQRRWPLGESYQA